MNILIPMAGEGSRFQKAGYTFPKPLVEVQGKPMIELVIQNLGTKKDYNWIFLVRKEHNEKYNISELLKRLVNKCNIIEVDKLTEGAACTALLARDLINNDWPLLIANSDQYVEWGSPMDFPWNAYVNDGAIYTFESNHPKWSFIKTDEKGRIIEVAEKKVISNRANTGIMYWAEGGDFVKYADKMIQKNIRINNEFYIAPVYNEAIADGKYLIEVPVARMHGLGTPEDLELFNKRYSIR